PVACRSSPRGGRHVDDGSEQDAEAAERPVVARKGSAPGSAEGRRDHVRRRGAPCGEGAHRERLARDRRGGTRAPGGGPWPGGGTPLDAGTCLVAGGPPQRRPLIGPSPPPCLASGPA